MSDIHADSNGATTAEFLLAGVTAAAAAVLLQLLGAGRGRERGFRSVYFPKIIFSPLK